jgi:hypothetical protein
MTHVALHRCCHLRVGHVVIHVVVAGMFGGCNRPVVSGMSVLWGDVRRVMGAAVYRVNLGLRGMAFMPAGGYAVVVRNIGPVWVVGAHGHGCVVGMVVAH